MLIPLMASCTDALMILILTCTHANSTHGHMHTCIGDLDDPDMHSCSCNSWPLMHSCTNLISISLVMLYHLISMSLIPTTPHLSRFFTQSHESDSTETSSALSPSLIHALLILYMPLLSNWAGVRSGVLISFNLA